MDKELISLLYQAEEAGLYDADVSDLDITVDDQLLTKITLENTGSTDLPEYTFWVHNSEDDCDVKTQLTDEQKLFILKETLAWY